MIDASEEIEYSSVYCHLYFISLEIQCDFFLEIQRDTFQAGVAFTSFRNNKS